MARAGSDSRPHGPEPILPLSSSYLRVALKDWLDEATQCRFASAKLSSKCTGPVQSLLDSSFSPSLFSAESMWLISQLFSGHSALRYFQHLIGHVSSSICQFCNSAEETSEHFFSVCPFFSRLRLQVFGRTDLSLSSVLYSCPMSQVVKFVRLARRFEKGVYDGRPPN